MDEWKPDEKFLEFLVKELNKDKSFEKPFIGAGTKSWSMRDLVEEMRQGTELGREIYQDSYANKKTQKQYKAYLSKKSE